MKARSILYKLSSQPFRGVFAMFCVATLTSSLSVTFGQETPAAAAAPTSTNTATPQEAWKLPADQLDSLVAPIALYADPLLSQTLVASTYPLEIIQLQQWMARNKSLKGKALSEAVQKQNWDPSIQAMVAVPDVVERLAGNIQWTTELGNAFLAQPDDLMNSVQRMRTKAQGTGALVTTAEQKVEKQTVEGGKEVIVIEQAKPEVIYVPSYDPVVVYGAPVYPYPSYVYPGYVPGTGLAFGAGLILGAAWGNGWGYHCGWGSGNVNINYNNNYINHYNKVNNIGNVNGGRWQHQPGHRGGAPYGPGGIGGVGGGTRPGGVGGVGGIGGAGRPGGVGGVGGVGGAGRPGGVGGAGRPGGVGGAGSIGGAGGAGRPGGAGSIGGAGGAGRPGGAGSIGGAGGAGRPGGAGSIGGAGGAGNRPSTMPATRPSGGNSIGNRSVSSGSGYGSSRSAFGGSSSGNFARSSSSRGASSMRSSGGGSRGGGGGSRGGGGGSRGGGRR